MSDDDEIRVTLRLPVKLRDRLLNAAQMNSRSMNGEIVDRLDYTFSRLDGEMSGLIDEANDLRAWLRILISSNKSLETTMSLLNRTMDMYESWLDEAANGDDRALRAVIEAKRDPVARERELEQTKRTAEPEANVPRLSKEDWEVLLSASAEGKPAVFSALATDDIDAALRIARRSAMDKSQQTSRKPSSVKTFR